MKKARLMLIISLSLTILYNCRFNGQNNNPAHTIPSKIYWFDLTEKKIKRANLDGTSIEEIITNINLSMNMTIDKKNDKIYWSDFDISSNLHIRRADMDGTNTETIANPAIASCWCLSINTDDNIIYWTSTSQMQIFKSDFSGIVSTLTSPDINDAGLLAVFYNKSDKQIYWGNQGSSVGNCNRIISVDALGDNRNEISIDTSSNGGIPLGTDRVVINPNDGKIYYSLSDIVEIKRQNLLDETDRDVLINGNGAVSSNCFNCLDIDPVNSHLYYTDETGNINRADLDGNNSIRIITNANQISDIAVY